MKHTKKMTSALLVASILATTPMWDRQPAMAAPATQNQGQEGKLPQVAETTLHVLYTIQPELKKMKRTVLPPKEGVYSLRFDKQIAAGKTELYAFVELDAATGALHRYENEQVGEGQDPPSEAVAKQKSAAFLQALLGADFNKYKASQTAKDDWSAVTYIRYENGLPVFTDRYVVGVNSTGVMYVNTFEGAPLRASSALFAKPGNVLPKEEVMRKVASHMELTYAARDRKTGKPSLRYSLESTGCLDAVTGEEIASGSATKSRYSGPLPVKPGGKKLTASSASEVAKVLAEEFRINVEGVSFEADQTMPAEMKGERETIYKSKAGNRHITVYTDNKAVTGFQIRDGLSAPGAAQNGNHPENARLTYEQAREKALQFLQPYLDPSVKELKLDQDMVLMPSATAYSFSFFALHDGVVVSDQHYLVNVDGQTGEIVNFMDYFTSPAAPFPDKKTAISKEAAAKQFLHAHPFALGYTFPVQNGKLVTKPRLVYFLDKTSSFLLDAVTGKSL